MTMDARMINRIFFPYSAPPISPYDPTTSFRVLTRSMKQYSENIANSGRSNNEKSIPPFLNLKMRRISKKNTLWGGIKRLYQQRISRGEGLLWSSLHYPFQNESSLLVPCVSTTVESPPPLLPALSPLRLK